MDTFPDYNKLNYSLITCKNDIQYFKSMMKIYKWKKTNFVELGQLVHKNKNDSQGNVIIWELFNITY